MRTRRPPGTAAGGERRLRRPEDRGADGEDGGLSPTTVRYIATIGGFISGGSAGIGTVSHGMLRDAGNILEIRVLSAEETPQNVVFRGDQINMIHHAWGINGVITELTLRTVPTEDWIGCIATFDSYPACYAAGMALAASDIRRKLCSTLDARIGTYFDRLKGIVPDGRAMLVTLIPRDLIARPWSPRTTAVTECRGSMDVRTVAPTAPRPMIATLTPPR